MENGKNPLLIVSFSMLQKHILLNALNGRSASWPPWCCSSLVREFNSQSFTEDTLPYSKPWLWHSCSIYIMRERARNLNFSVWISNFQQVGNKKTYTTTCMCSATTSTLNLLLVSWIIILMHGYPAFSPSVWESVSGVCQIHSTSYSLDFFSGSSTCGAIALPEGIAASDWEIPVWRREVWEGLRTSISVVSLGCP